MIPKFTARIGDKFTAAIIQLPDNRMIEIRVGIKGDEETSYATCWVKWIDVDHDIIHGEESKFASEASIRTIKKLRDEEKHNNNSV